MLTIDPEQFVATWQACHTRQEVMARTGLSKDQVYAASYRLRKQGVRLKVFGYGPRAVNVRKLNRICANGHGPTE